MYNWKNLKNKRCAECNCPLKGNKKNGYVCSNKECDFEISDLDIPNNTVYCALCGKKMTLSLANTFDPMVMHAFCIKCNFLIVRDWDGSFCISFVNPKDIKKGIIKYSAGNLTGNY